jgi:hypothetical protein
MTTPAEPTSTPAPAAPAAAAPASEPASSPTAEPGRSWMDRLLGRVPANADPVPAPASDADAQEQSKEPDATTPRTYTQDEIQRLVQGESDRRDAKRQRETQDAERRRLRKEDPYAYAEGDELHEQQAQAAAQFGNQIATVASSIDRAVLDPLLERVPEKLRGKLFEDPNAGVGLDGRKALVVKALDQLKREWTAEGRAAAADALLDDPIHQKKVLARVRGEPDYEEPDNVQGSATKSNGRDVSAILRESLGY